MSKADDIRPTAYTKGAKRRRKRNRQALDAVMIDLPALAPIKRREKSGCFVDRKRQQPDDPDPAQTVLRRRCRDLGLAPEKANMALVNTALLSEPAGMAIHLCAKGEDERADLWKTFCDVDRAEETYYRRILGVARHAKVGRMEMLPEDLTSENVTQPDSRDDETKDLDAVNNWMHWRGLAQMLGAARMGALYDGVMRRKALVRPMGVTLAGMAFVDSLRQLTAIARQGRIKA